MIDLNLDPSPIDEVRIQMMKKLWINLLGELSELLLLITAYRLRVLSMGTSRLRFIPLSISMVAEIHQNRR